jgi:hypothetical protein
MSNLSTATRYVANAVENPELLDLCPAFAGKDNADFLAEVARRLSARQRATHAQRKGSTKKAARKKASDAAREEEREIAADGVLAIGLLGEYGPLGYALRRAQEVLRIDRTPSHWSHAFLFLDPLRPSAASLRDPERSPRVLEATLDPGDSASRLFAFRNGVNVRRFSDFARARFDVRTARSVPNIAVLCVALSAGERAAIRERALRPEADLLAYDLPDLLGNWLHFALSLGKRRNPLLRGTALPSASYAQLAYDAAGIDLSPGATQRNSAPEHFWQAARYLYPMFEAPDAEGNLVRRPLLGFHCVREPECLLAPAGTQLPRSFEELVEASASSGG